ncbi:MAG: surface-adhesin E family protein [Nitrospiraceae bacterium]
MPPSRFKFRLTVQDAPKKAPEPFLSSRAQYGFDCAEERTRKLSETWFSGNMGSGEMVHSISDETRWEPVAPGSVGQAMWKAACEKK